MLISSNRVWVSIPEARTALGRPASGGKLSERSTELYGMSYVIRMKTEAEEGHPK
jgi:hypothetical protein